MPKRKDIDRGDIDRQISQAELSSHAQENDCWIAVDGTVYDVTRYLDYHPGTKENLLNSSGKDATVVFHQNHAEDPEGAIASALHSGLVERIGFLTPSTDTVSSTPAPSKRPLLHRPVQTGALKVAELRVYPVKSCGSGAAADKVVVDRLGPQYDRCLMVCHKPHWNNRWQDTWGAVTPRTIAKNPADPAAKKIDGPSLLLVDVTMNRDATMTISSRNEARHMPDLRIAVKPPAGAPLIENVTRWDCDGLKAYEIEDASKWFSECAARALRGRRPLVVTSFASPGVKVLSAVAPDHAVPAWSRVVSISESNTMENNPGDAFRGWDRGMSFSDTSQFLVVSRASCDAMREQHPDLDWNVLRFRPNVVVEGCRPFEEDTWKRIRIGGESGIVLELHRACKRCQVTSYNPSTAVPDSGAQTTISVLKTQRAARDDVHGGVVGLFGQYAIHQNSGQILVNQEIEVLEYKSQNDKKHPLVHPNAFIPHVLKSSFFQSFRVLSNVCDDPTNPRPTHRLVLEVDTSASLPTGKHVKLRAFIGGQWVNRSYTPICFAGGRCEIFFRVYAAPEGSMSRHLKSLRQDDWIEMKGPVGDAFHTHELNSQGFSAFGGNMAQAYSHLVLLAGGTGITPMLQIASSTLLNPSNKTRVSLLSFSSNESDICLYQDLVRLQLVGAASCAIKFFASKLCSADARHDVTEGSLRNFTAPQLLEHVGVAVFESTMFCMCGPREFISTAKTLLTKCGVADSCVLAWE